MIQAPARQPARQIVQRHNQDCATGPGLTEARGCARPVITRPRGAEEFPDPYRRRRPRGDGRPHVTPLPAIWLDGVLHFCTGSHEQKARNLQFNPRCILTTGANQFQSGLDVVVEGTAARITSPARLQQLAAIWKSKLDWDFHVADGGFRDPEGRTGLVFGIKPAKVLAFGKSPYSQTRYRFTT
jgi:hypothetical protein